MRGSPGAAAALVVVVFAGGAPAAAECCAWHPAQSGEIVTICLAPSARLRSEIHALVMKGAPAIRRVALSVNGVRVRGPRWTDVRVFLNLPSANADTPLTAPEYVGKTTYSSQSTMMSGALHELAPVLKRLADAKTLDPYADFTLTFVPVPSRGESTEPLGYAFETARLVD